MEVLFVDAGLALAAIGFLSLLRPLTVLRIRTRPRAALVLGAGLLVAAFACALPVRPPRLPGPAMELDRLMPRYQFGEHHEIRIDAPSERVYPALRAVTASEIRLFRLLTWIRSPRLHSGGPETILSPGAERPILDVALGSTFVLLYEEPGREIVVGMIVCCGPRRPARTAEEFWAAKGSVARAVMSFHLEEVGDATRLVTQTRIHASDAAALRRFAAYWRVIYPGSAFLRVMWLRAIRDRVPRWKPDPGAEGFHRDLTSPARYSLLAPPFVSVPPKPRAPFLSHVSSPRVRVRQRRCRAPRASR